MNNDANTNLHAEIDDDFGPAMSACLPKERAFVLALLEGRNGAQAAREAGYGNDDGSSSAETMARIAHRMLTRGRVIGALAEQCKQSIRSLAPTALQAARNILTNSTHKGHERVVLALLDRIDPPQSNSSVKVEVTHKADDDTFGLIFDYYRELKALGADRSKLFQTFGHEYLGKCERMLAEGTGNVIEGEFTELVDDGRLLTVDDL